jgi:hypothetical protein
MCLEPGCPLNPTDPIEPKPPNHEPPDEAGENAHVNPTPLTRAEAARRAERFLFGP